MLQAVLFVKVVLALLSDRPAAQYLDAQRLAHLDRMRELTAMRKAGPLSRSLLADYGLFHLEADLRWIDLTAARLDQLRKEISQLTGSCCGQRTSASRSVRRWRCATRA